MDEIMHLPDEYMPKIADMPGELQRVALGLEGAFPGQGARITIALAQLFGGQYIYVRKADPFLRRWRDDAIRRRYNQGDITVSELVSMFKLSARQLYNILGKAEAIEETQLPLFGRKQP